MMAPAARRSQRDPGNAQIIARRFTPHSRCLLDSTQGPPKPSQRDHLFASLFAQDISHPTEANGPRRKLCLDLFAMAGFQVTLYGRVWVTGKEKCTVYKNECTHFSIFTFKLDLMLKDLSA